jgi:hypothetical protein
MNVVVVTDTGVDTYKKWSDVEKNHAISKPDFVRYGNDYVAYMDNESHQISKDIKLIEAVASKQIFGKPKVDVLTVFTNGFVLVMILAFMQ